jgi:hypothetical protein
MIAILRCEAFWSPTTPVVEIPKSGPTGVLGTLALAGSAREDFGCHFQNCK